MKTEHNNQVEYLAGINPNPEYPGIGGTQFTVILNKDWKAPLETPLQLEITKVYKQSLWKKFLLWLGFKVSFYEVKVIKNENK